MQERQDEIRAIEQDWGTNPRWKGVKRGYGARDVVRLRGSVRIEHTLARRGAEKLWLMMHERPFVNSLGALTGNQAVQQVKAGVPAIYLSGWQVAADANDSLQMYPDQSLYAVSSVPTVVKRINNALARADQIQWMEADAEEAKAGRVDYFAPVVADAEAGFGGVLNAYELMRSMIEAGAAGVHFEDQLAAAKKCGHMGGKVLVPTQEAIEKLIAARFAADVMGVPTIVLARTDAEAANLITSIHDYGTGSLSRCTVIGGYVYRGSRLPLPVDPALLAERRAAPVRQQEARVHDRAVKPLGSRLLDKGED